MADSPLMNPQTLPRCILNTMEAEARRAKIRQNRATLALIGRALGHVSMAVMGWALDSAARYIGRVWATALACLIVRNGRFIPLLSLLADWVIGAADTTFVFTVTILIVLVAQPLVFPDLDMPATEVWYDHTRTGAVTVPAFVMASLLLHYPRATIRVIKGSLNDPPRIHEVAYWIQVTFACLSVPYAVHTLLLPSQAFRGASEVFWRSLGKRFHDLRKTDNLASPGPFSYTELQGEWDIRLVELLPRGTSDQVRCRLVTVGLDGKAPPYEAMSYTWGDPTKSHAISVNGHTIKTTRNVYNLLYERSPLFSPRRVWIDAICINQDDHAEKAGQVRIMKYIYKCCSKVTIWLGAGQDSRLAVDLILELSHHIAADNPTDAELYEKYKTQRRSRRWLALGLILDHPYFSRMWMVQEVALNKTLHVVYGRETINWDTLAPVMLHLFGFRFSTMIEDNITPAHKRRRVMSMNSLFLDKARKTYHGKDQASPNSLLLMLPRFWTFSATDGRDKVFALLGLAQDAENPLIEPDYTKPVEDVFLHTAWYLYSQDDSLEAILYCAGIGWRRNLPSLPSWVPDWTEVGRSVISKFPRPGMGYRTAIGLRNRGPVIHGAVIELDVILVDTVKCMTREHRQPDTDDEVYEEALSWLREVRSIADGSEEDLWRTLICDAPTVSTGDSVMGMVWPAPGVYGNWYEYCMRHLLQDPDFDPGPRLPADEEGERIQLGSRWLTSAKSRCNARRFAMTQGGRMALVPAMAEAGDVLAVVPGINVPFVLRHRRSGTISSREVYALVGECYAHGIMNGEMADASKAEMVMLE